MIRRALATVPCLIALAACGLAPREGASQPVSPYRATAVGRIDSATEARQLVAEADGVIAEVLVERDQAVAAGQPLLEVRCDERHSEAAQARAMARRAEAAESLMAEGTRREAIAAAEAALQAAEARVLDSEQRYRQADPLMARGFMSKRDYEARVNALGVSRAEAAEAAARLAELRSGPRRQERAMAAAEADAAASSASAMTALRNRCTLRSPIAGRVLQILRREGEFSGASQGTPLIVVGDLSRLMVRAEINERDVAAARLGGEVDVWMDGSEGRWRGRITEIAGIMGRRSARSLDPTDRFDRDTREALVTLDGPMPPALVGLRVMIGIRP
jgi:multidrug resistance efflux pump